MRDVKLATYMTRNRLIAICVAFFLIAGTRRTHGLDPNKRLTQYRHNMWRVQDGFLPGYPLWVSQTVDGYLWVGSPSIGAFRFDGIRFVPWSSPALTSNGPYLFVPAKSGGFWIGGALGLSHVRGNLVVSHFNLNAPPTRMVESENGSLWVTTLNRSGSTGPLCHATDRELTCLGKEEGFPIQEADSIVPDGTGGFWIGSDTSLFYWKEGVSKLYEVQALRSNSGQIGISSLVQNSDGSLWVGIGAAGRGLGLVQFRNATFKPFLTPNFDGSKINVSALLMDRDNGLWVATVNNGLYRIHANAVDHFVLADGLSSNTVNNLYEDQEGVIWAVTSKGLDSFQDPSITTYTAAEGLGADEAVSVIASHDGTVWLANAESLDSIHNGTVLSIGKKNGLPGHQVTSVLEDREGHLWVGVDDELYIYENRHFRPVSTPNHSAMGMVVGMTEDIDGNIWAECIAKQRRLVRIRDFKVREVFSDSQVPAGHSLAADPSGGIWVGTVDGRLASLHKGKVDIFPMNLKGDAAVRQIEVQPDGSVIAAAVDDGLISFRAGVVERLGKQNGLPCDGVFGFNRDDRKNWWLSTRCGYVELADAEIQKWRNDPGSLLQGRLLDSLDGARTGPTPFSPAAKSSDGRLWFVDGSVVQTIDPARLANGSSVRPVYVESVTADRAPYLAQDGLKLPARTRDIQIDYTSPSFSIPKKVNFRYRLEGNDSTWQDAGTRRQAFFSNLSPGQYRFTAIASNEDGTWNPQGATLQFSVLPAWFQTIWFRIFCVAAFFLSLAGFYRMRLRQVRQQFNVSLEARVNERTRIARDLHDTLLQTLHGLLMSFQRAANLLPERPVEAKQRLEGAIDEAAQAITEGREAVQGLRSSTVVTNDLALAIQSVGEELAVKQTTQNPPLFNVAVEGTARDLNPILRDDVYRIAGEALRNAFHHAQARRVEVEIHYDDRQLRLRVRDDGKGISAQLLSNKERSGHWGLQGMRERSKLVGGRLEIWSELDSGTEIELRIPASIAYLNSTPKSRKSTTMKI